MPQAIPAVIAGVKSAVAAYAAWAAAHPILAAGVKLAVSAAVTAVLTPDIPTPEMAKTNVSQSRPKRRLMIGTARVSGAHALREAENGIYQQVIMFPEGPLASFDRAWIDDDLVSIVGGVVQELPDRRYATGNVTVDERLGLPVETVYSGLVAEMPGVWTNAHLLNYIPTNWVRMKAVKQEKQQLVYPRGVQSELTREATAKAYDWRKDSTSGGSGSHRRPASNSAADLATAWATWEPSDNAYVNAINVLWRHYGEDWDTRFAPVIALMTEQAAICDEAVPNKGGGSAARYRSGFWYEAGTPIKTILNTLLGTMDGWFGIRKDGAYVVRAGAYYEPTAAFGDAEIFDWKFNPGEYPGAITNELLVSFADPDSAYNAVDVDSWRNEASIAKWGEKPQDFFLTGVNWWRQARRLAKATMDREFSAEGSFRTPLSSRRGLGERFIRLRCSDSEDLYDLVVEILDADVDYETASITWQFKVANPERYDWDADTEEGNGPVSDSRPVPVEPDAPTIDDITPLFDTVSGGANGVRLSVEGAGPSRTDLTWFLRWKVTTDASFSPAGQFDDTDPDVSTVTLLSGFVTADAALDVQIGYSTGSGSITWSASETVTTTVPDTDTMLGEDGDDMLTEDGDLMVLET